MLNPAMGISERSVATPVTHNGAPDPSESLGRAVANIIRVAKESAETLRQEATAEATETLQQAVEKAERIGRDAADRAASLLDEAAGRAERLTHEADRHTRELHETAQRQCEAMLQVVLQRQQWLKAQEDALSTRLQLAAETLARLRSLLVSDQEGQRLQLVASDDPHPETVPSQDQAMPAGAADVTDREGAAEGSPRIVAE
jgi:cell division septum initiation protein DivIVA